LANVLPFTFIRKLLQGERVMCLILHPKKQGTLLSTYILLFVHAITLPCILTIYLNCIFFVLFWLQYKSLSKIRHTVCQISGVYTRFQVYHPCLHVAHRNSCVNGANFVINHYKTCVNTLKLLYSIQTCLLSLTFSQDIISK